MRILLRLFLWVVCCACVWLVCSYYHQQIIAKIENANILVISKQDMHLNLINYKGDTLFSAPIAVGKAYGNKQKQGDMRTPEGVFQIVDIQNSTEWKHDFHDGKGDIEGAYGPHFIRLRVPGHSGIGIHGTHLPESIGSRVTEGCIRLNNDDLRKLVTLIYPPLTVIITPAAMDENQNALNLKKIRSIRNRVSPPNSPRGNQETRFLLSPQTKNNKKHLFQPQDKQKDLKTLFP